jgi:hypothetical protein
LFGSLVSKLKFERLFDLINIIVVSDHGMASFNGSTNILINNYVMNGTIDMDKSVIWGVVSNLYANEGYVN